MKDFIFSKSTSLFLATLLRKWTSSYVFFLKSRHFTEQVWEAFPPMGGVYYEIMFETYDQFG